MSVFTPVKTKITQKLGKDEKKFGRRKKKRKRKTTFHLPVPPFRPLTLRYVLFPEN
jgi:hypothetical protein